MNFVTKLTTEEIIFTGNICMAANLLDIKMKASGDEVMGYVFAFLDPYSGGVIVSEAKEDKPSALLDCCKKLQDHLCAKDLQS